MKLMFKEKNEWNDLELKTGYATLITLIDRIAPLLVNCNKILELDKDLLNNVVVGTPVKDEEYEAFLCNLSDEDIKYANEIEKSNKDNLLIIAYSTMLECHVLLVPKSIGYWDEKLTQIKLTDDFDTYFFNSRKLL